MISASYIVALPLALAAAQSSNATTYNVTISWYGTNDPKGSPNCNSNTVACGFYTYVRYTQMRYTQNPAPAPTNKTIPQN